MVPSVCVWGGVGVRVQVLWSPEEGVRSTEGGLTGGCQSSSDIGA